jgi:hypothetical protein
MKSVFEQSTREELVNRINSLSPDNNAQWGKMNVYQMVRHCVLCEDMYDGTIKIKRVFIGRLIGPMFLRKALKDEKPFGKNAPTDKILKTVGDNGDLQAQKKEWIRRIQHYANYSFSNFVHPFFGPMTKEQFGLFSYKHTDHHLRQFGA